MAVGLGAEVGVAVGLGVEVGVGVGSRVASGVAVALASGVGVGVACGVGTLVDVVVGVDPTEIGFKPLMSVFCTRSHRSFATNVSPSDTTNLIAYTPGLSGVVHITGLLALPTVQHAEDKVPPLTIQHGSR